MENVTIEPIGVVHSCFTEKFGIPRQPGMVKSSVAFLELFKAYNREEMIRGLEEFSHVWVHFLFHETVDEGWKPTIRPPWLGGKKRVGIFASRSPHRPNHMGISAVRLVAIRKEKTKYILELAEVDLLDQTPVFDIKPYVPYSDCIHHATGGYTRVQKSEIAPIFSQQASDFCVEYQNRTGRAIRVLIEEMVQQDPRPASQKERRRDFGMLLWDVNIRWQVSGDQFRVLSCERIIPQ